MDDQTRVALEEAQIRLLSTDARFYALVKMLGMAIFHGDFTAIEVLAALPKADEYATNLKIREAALRTPIFNIPSRGEADA